MQRNILLEGSSITELINKPNRQRQAEEVERRRINPG
jgi:hypothetical protein